MNVTPPRPRVACVVCDDLGCEFCPVDQPPAYVPPTPSPTATAGPRFSVYETIGRLIDEAEE